MPSKRPITAVKRKKPKEQVINDDLDDLDDLMGGGDGEKDNAGQTLDDHDFFGGGRDDEDEDYNPKKKKGKQNDDPLAFLQRAQQEK